MTGPLDKLPAPDVSTRRIYAYQLGLNELEGRIKVGETGRSVPSRVKEQVNTAGLSDVVEILMDEPAVTRDGRAFRDAEVIVTPSGSSARMERDEIPRLVAD